MEDIYQSMLKQNNNEIIPMLWMAPTYSWVRKSDVHNLTLVVGDTKKVIFDWPVAGNYKSLSHQIRDTTCSRHVIKYNSFRFTDYFLNLAYTSIIDLFWQNTEHAIHRKRDKEHTIQEYLYGKWCSQRQKWE